MREKLEPYRGKRIKVQGIFDKFGYRIHRDGARIITALIQAITHDGQDVATHCHVQYADNFEALELKHGEIVEFTAVVMEYKRRLANTNAEGVMVERDYGLYHPTEIRCIDRPEREQQLVKSPVQTLTLQPQPPDVDEEEIEEEPAAQWQPGLVTSEEAAGLFGVSIQTVYNRIRDAGLFPVKVEGRQRHFLKDEVARLFADNPPRMQQPPARIQQPPAPSEPSQKADPLSGANSLQALRRVKELGESLGWDVLAELVDLLRPVS